MINVTRYKKLAAEVHKKIMAGVDMEVAGKQANAHAQLSNAARMHTALRQLINEVEKDQTQ